MENLPQQILRFLSRGKDWANTAHHPVCFLRLDPDKKEVQVRRWGRSTKIHTEPFYFWKKINVKSYVIMDDIEEALKRWEKYDPTFSIMSSEYPPEPNTKIRPSASYYGL